MTAGEHDEGFSIHRPPPAPDDRLWRHPAELGWQARQNPPPPPHAWITITLSLGGGVLMLGALWLAANSSVGLRASTQQVSAAPVDSAVHQVPAANEAGAKVGLGDMPPVAIVRSAHNDEVLAGAVRIGHDGYLLTSGRAIEGHDQLMVHTAEGQTSRATLVGYDPATDISVIRTDARIKLAQVATRPATGGNLVALVHPDGISRVQTVIEQASMSTAVDGDLLIGLVGLDTTIGAVPPGSPAVDLRGAVVGIITATDKGARATVVPIALAARIAAGLIANGTFVHPRLGITVSELFETDHQNGAGSRVKSTEPDGPADLGGVLPRDIIVGIGGETIGSMAEMFAVLRRHQPGDVVEVLVERRAQPVICEVRLGSNAHTGG